MPANRVDFRFGLFNQGWTETLYRTDATLGQTLTAGIGLMQNFSLGFRDSRVFSEGIKASQVVPPAPRTTSRDPAAGNGGRGGFSEDVVNTAVLVSLASAAGPRRAGLLRGLNDADTIRDPVTGAFTPSAGLLLALGFYLQALIANNWQIQYLDPSLPTIGIDSVTVSPTNPQLTQFTTLTPHGFSPGFVIYFKRVPLQTLPWLKGKWIVRTVPNVTTFTIGYPFPTPGAYTLARTGVRQVSYLYSPIVSTTILNLRSRKTGSGLRPTRGRARGIPFRR